ncbi:Cytokinin-activating enzyme working in the direct activation pathway [Orobanche minor]
MESSSSTKRFTSICIFGGASHGNEACFTEAADNLGSTLGEKCMHIVYGGGSLGLMGRAAASAYMEGVRVLGFIPKPLAESKITGATIGDEFRAVNMQDRISHMINNADAFITLPGGFGTLEELFHVVTRAQLNIHKKPISLLNVNGFFDGLLTFINYSFEKGFISEGAKRIIVVATTPEELIKKLIVFVPEPDPALSNIVWTENFSVRKCKVDTFMSL